MPPAPPPPPPAQTWRIVKTDYNEHLSRVPSINEDTTGIFFNAYYEDPNGTFIFEGRRFMPISLPVVFEPWVIETNMAYTKFYVTSLRYRNDEFYIRGGTLCSAIVDGAVQYLKD